MTGGRAHRAIVASVWLAAVALLLIFLSLAGGAGAVTRTTVVDRPAPRFTLTPATGARVSLDDLSGRIVVLNFWASWCDPCRAEALVLERAWRDYRAHGVSVVGVAIHDVEQPVRAFVRRYNVTYANGLDRANTIAPAYGVFDVPETYIIGRDGRILRRHVGPLSEAELRALLDDLLR